MFLCYMVNLDQLKLRMVPACKHEIQPQTKGMGLTSLHVMAHTMHIGKTNLVYQMCVVKEKEKKSLFN